MSNNRNQIAKAGAGYVFGNYLLKGITFLSAPIFTRLLTTDEYGILGTYFSYESIIYILMGIALHSSINSAKVKYGDKINKYISSIILLTFLSYIVWAFVGNAFYPIYAERIGFSRFIVNILLVHSFSSSIQQIYNVKISLNYEYKTYIKLSYLNAIGNLLISVVLMLTVFNNNRITGRVLGSVAPMLVVSGIIIFVCFKAEKPVFSANYWKYAVKYSIPIVPHGISQIILNTFDRIMIKDMIGASEAGIYSFAYTLDSIVKVAKTSLENIWKPWLYEKMENKEYSSIKKGGSNYAVGMAFFTILVILVSPEIIKILGDKAYWNSVDCVVPVILGGFFAFLYSIPSIVEYYYEKTKFIALGTVSAAVINIILNYIYIPKYGYIAAAYTTLFTYFLYFVFHFILAWKIHGDNLFSIPVLVLVSALVLGVGEGVMLLQGYWYVRWGITIIVGITCIIWAEKTFGVVSKLKCKMYSK